MLDFVVFINTRRTGTCRIVSSIGEAVFGFPIEMLLVNPGLFKCCCCMQFWWEVKVVWFMAAVAVDLIRYVFQHIYEGSEQSSFTCNFGQSRKVLIHSGRP